MTTRTTTKPLADCYKFVRKTGSTMVHALWEKEDKTMCGTHDVLELESSPAMVVSCTGCNAALKKERQRRSAEGTQRGADRRLAAHYRTEAENESMSEDAKSVLIEVKDQAGSAVAKRVIRIVAGVDDERVNVKLMDIADDPVKMGLARRIGQLVIDLGQKAMQPAMGLAPGNYGGFTVNPAPDTPRPPPPPAGAICDSIPKPEHDSGHRRALDAEANAYTLALNLKKSSVMSASMFGKVVPVCTYCLAVRREDDIVYEHEEDCPVILADQVIENYGGGK